jgi:hypothetical protein
MKRHDAKDAKIGNLEVRIRDGAAGAHLASWRHGVSLISETLLQDLAQELRATTVVQDGGSLAGKDSRPASSMSSSSRARLLPVGVPARSSVIGEVSSSALSGVSGTIGS